MIFYAGAMESHSTMMLRLEAEKQNKEIIWWDPNFEEGPCPGKHGSDAKVQLIRICLPEKYRKG